MKSWRNDAFKIELLKLEEIKPVNIKEEYSFTSHILLYRNYFMQILKWNLQRFITGRRLGGDLLHQTIEDIHKAVLREEVIQPAGALTNWFNENYCLSKSQRCYLHQAQQDALLQQGITRYRDINLTVGI